MAEQTGLVQTAIWGFPFGVVAPETQNILLVRCPIQVWDEVEAILRELDRP